MEIAPGQDASWQLIAQGAEARVWRATFLGRPAVVKERFRKAYRHPALDDKLTAQRVGAEARVLNKLKRLGIATPTVYFLDLAGSRIYMEYVEGLTVKAFLHSAASTPDARRLLAADIGRGIAAIHNAGVVHGDLTTSNMMLRGLKLDEPLTGPSSSFPLVFIDFGLVESSVNAEEKGVDLYVLQRAITSAHASDEAIDSFFEAILEAYFGAVTDAPAVRTKFAAVRMRGRKRLAFG